MAYAEVTMRGATEREIRREAVAAQESYVYWLYRRMARQL